MVFDNVGDPRAAAEWIPPRGLGHVIITTVRPRSLTGPRISEIEIPQMSISESVQLLSLRLAGNSPVAGEQAAKLTSLAGKLYRWPLALEIASAYLLNCLGGMSGIDEFERLVMRSLDDEDSVPHGYPNTLVRAIDLSWHQMINREDAAYKHAVFALQCSGFTGSRQIPLQILLTTSIVNFDAVLEHNPSDGFIGYGLSEPPAGEIFRAMRSYSLTYSDIPFTASDTNEDINPSSFGFSVQVNEIVQSIIRERFLSRQLTENSINAIALVAQHWLSAAHERRNFDLLQALVGHAIAASDYAIQYDVANIAIAFLWGNAATVLRTLGYAELAVPYLRHELDLFHNEPTPVPIYHMQTAATLADVLIQSAEDRRAILDEASTVLEECLGQVPKALTIDYNVTANTVRTAMAATLSLFPEAAEHQRICAIRDEFARLVDATPLSEGPDTFEAIMEIGRMVQSSEYEEARSLIEPMLGERDVRDPEAVSLMRLLTECLVGLGEWESARTKVNTFAERARKIKTYQEEAGIFCRNVGIGCFAEVVYGRNIDAIKVFDAVVDFFDETLADSGKMDLVARSTGSVLSALRACIIHDFQTAALRLADVQFENLPKFGGTSLLGLTYQLLTRVVGAVPAKLATYTESEPVQSTANGHQISNIPPRIHHWAVAESRPSTAVLTTQWRLAGGRPAREPIEIATELMYAFLASGIKASLVEAKLDVFLASGDFGISENSEPYWNSNAIGRVPVFASKTYGLRVDSPNIFIDPTVPALAPRYRNITRHSVEEEFPVLSPSSRDIFSSPFILPRSHHIVRYRNMESKELLDAWGDRSERAHVECATNGLLTAMCSLVEQFSQPKERVSQISAMHPQLRELVGLYRGVANLPTA